ncbi:MAG: AAA family ATPase [Gammaproteobacteria bacterium]|nr:AAA family ATPase [Gammaproteobacteria bacterium]
MTVVVISGPPGAGKSTLAATLAERCATGVHLHSDDFYRYLSHPLDPSTPASKSQNETVVDAFLAAANAYAGGGFEVYLDGVIGPWWLPTLKATLPDFRYVMLMIDLDSALHRTARRGSQPSATPRVVREMHRQFARDASRYAASIIDTTGLSTDAVLVEYVRRMSQGGFEPPSMP